MNHTPSSSQKEMAHGYWETNLCPSHGFSTGIRIPSMCPTIPWSLQDEEFFMLGSVPLHGLCAAHISRKFVRYRGLPSLGPAETLPHGYPEQSLSQYPGSRQPVRNWQIYADFAQILIGRARRLYANDSFGVELNQTAYALDSTLIDLCLSLFPWAKFRKHKGAVKLHTLLDLRGSIPSIVLITHGKIHDVTIFDQLIFEPGAFYPYNDT